MTTAVPLGADSSVTTVESTARPAGALPLLTGARLTRWDALTASLIGLALTLFAVVYRSPIVPTDPWHYVRSALQFPSDDWVPLGFTRYGIILANIPPAFMFKNAEVVYYFWPLLVVFILSATIYLVGRRFWGPLAGAVAVVLLFANSVVLYNLTRGYPDLMSMALLFSAVLCAVLARDHGLRGRGATAWILAAGFLLGWGVEVRETFVLAWPIVLALLWRRGSVLRVYALLALPVVFWAALDIGLSGIFYGDPLLKAHTLTGTNPTGVGNVPPPPPIKLDAADRTRWGFFLGIPKTAINGSAGGWWMVLTGLVAMLGVFSRNRALRLVSWSFVILYGLNLLAGGVLIPSRPFGTLINPRYWVQYFPFIALALGGITSLVAAAIVRRMPSAGRTASTAVAVGLALLVCAYPVVQAVRFVPTVPSFAANGGNDLERLRDHLAGTGFEPAVIWTDWETRRLVPIFQRPLFGGDKVWGGKVKTLSGSVSPQPGDAVLLYSARSDVCDHCRAALKPWLDENRTIPDGWELLYEDDEGTLQLYRVTG